MSTTAVVDTHALIWFLGQNPLLGNKAREILRDPTAQLIVPTIVLCELFAYLKKKKDVEQYRKIYDDIRQDTRFSFKDLTPDLILKIPPQLELHDGIIAATLTDTPQAVLLSKDDELKEWGGTAVIWK